MNKIVLLALGLGLGALYAGRANASLNTESYLLTFNDALGSVANTVNEAIETISGGFTLNINRMKDVTINDVYDSNVRAFLRVIRKGEGTSDAAGYKRHFGGELFESFDDHPRRVIRKNGYASSAAGAYQFLASTWDETARLMGLVDFSPENQDLGAVGRIAARGALEDVKMGRFEIAIKKCAKEWASLPHSPYGQPTISMATAESIYTNHGGTFA